MIPVIKAHSYAHKFVSYGVFGAVRGELNIMISGSTQLIMNVWVET